MSVLRVRVRHGYSSGFALEVDFETSAVTTSLFGPSGSGKTTLLSMIAGLRHPQEGTITFGDRTLLDTARGVRLPPEKRQIGFVFQNHLLFPHLTVEQNLHYAWQRRLDINRDITFSKVVDILELGPCLQQSPHTLSGGQQQRVSLGRALLRRPALLLMDEPLTFLDEMLKSRVLAYLERVVREWSIPTIYVSHNPVEVQRLAERVIVLKSGRVLDEGRTADVLHHHALFEPGGLPGPTNLLRVTGIGQNENGDWHGRVGDQILSLPQRVYAAESAWMMFPPESVSLSRAAPEAVSVRNRLAGRIESLIPLKDRMLIGVDVGQQLWAEITHEAQRELEFAEGMTVFCLVKTLSMTPIF